MGTRSLTFVYDSYKNEDGATVYEPIINLYRQYDGYPSGHGQDLVNFLAPLRVGNGISGDSTNFANGMGCLAAQLVAHFKDGAGQFYLYSPNAKDCGQDYEYHIYTNSEGELCVQVTDRGCNLFGLTMSDTNESLFDGPILRFEEFCKEGA